MGYLNQAPSKNWVSSHSWWKSSPSFTSVIQRKLRELKLNKILIFNFHYFLVLVATQCTLDTDLLRPWTGTNNCLFCLPHCSMSDTESNREINNNYMQLSCWMWAAPTHVPGLKVSFWSKCQAETLNYVEICNCPTLWKAIFLPEASHREV